MKAKHERVVYYCKNCDKKQEQTIHFKSENMPFIPACQQCDTTEGVEIISRERLLDPLKNR